jgi:hypothetical protein
MTSVVEVGTMKTAAPENKLSRTLKVAAVGAVVGMAVTIGISYPVLDDKWNAPAASPAPLACSTAQPQSPKDVSSTFTGSKAPRAVAVDEAVTGLTHVNTHYHLGAEHKSAGQYDKQHDTSHSHARRLLSAETEYGYYCDDVAWVQGLTTAQKTDYNWQYCENTHVGKTYEMHWVYSSGGEGDLSAGLGGAFDSQNNPKVTVRAQVYHIVNDNTYDRSDLLDGWDVAAIQATIDDATTANDDPVTYSGSTTGRSYNNDDSCSPYQINWQVDRVCRRISAKSFDDMCKKMKEQYGMDADAEPHSSRDLVSTALSANTQTLLSRANV